MIINKSLDSSPAVENITDDDMRFLTTEEVAQYMRCSAPVARQMMRRKDFPLVKVGKNLRVMKCHLVKWASERRI